MSDKPVLQLVATGQQIDLGGEQWPVAPEGWWSATVAKDQHGRFFLAGNCTIAGQPWTNCIAEWIGDHWQMMVAGGELVFTV